jgi:hypothetical protein
MRIRHAAVAGVVLVAFAACTSSPLDVVLVGQWAGSNAALTVRVDDADVELVCGGGHIDGALDLATDGTFSAMGDFAAGPVAHLPEPAAYAGIVHRDVMTLTIVTLNPADTVGTFTLFRGREPTFVTCQ